MSKLDEFWGKEKLDDSLINKDSSYAYITYLESMGTTEINSDGEIVQFNRAKLAGQVDLISPAELERLSSYFPDRVNGKVITYGNLENVVNLFFDKLKEEYSQLGQSDEHLDSMIERLNSFSRDGKLNADHQDESSLDDLANKVFLFQENVRNLQSRNFSNSSVIKK